jgi:hypothetical protein
MILPLLHERSCKKKKITHYNSNKEMNLENKHPQQQQQQQPGTNTHHHHHNINKQQQQQQKELREEDFVFERKIFKNLCTRIAG